MVLLRNKSYEDSIIEYQNLGMTISICLTKRQKKLLKATWEKDGGYKVDPWWHYVLVNTNLTYVKDCGTKKDDDCIDVQITEKEIFIKLKEVVGLEKATKLSDIKITVTNKKEEEVENNVVELRLIPCLSYNQANEKYYAKKAFVGDTVDFWLNNTSRLVGVIDKIEKDRLVIIGDMNKKIEIKYKDIKSYMIIYRSKKSEDMLGR